MDSSDNPAKIESSDTFVRILFFMKILNLDIILHDFFMLNILILNLFAGEVLKEFYYPIPH